MLAKANDIPFSLLIEKKFMKIMLAQHQQIAILNNLGF